MTIAQNSLAQGVPVHVNPVIVQATGAEGEHLGLEMRVGPDEVSVEKRQPHTHFAQTYGVPIHVNPVTMRATGAEAEHLGLDMKIGPDEVSVVRKHHPKRHLALVDRKGVPVLVDPIIADPTGAETEDLEHADFATGNMRIGFDEGISVAQKRIRFAQAGNPVVNPPFNNWSVNQPSVPHDQGYEGTEDFGESMVLGGHQIDF